MPKGGRQPGSGRPKGSLSAVTQKTRIAAMETGLLPHEWLLKVARGEPVEHTSWKRTYDDVLGCEVSKELVTEIYYADFPMRVDCAKHASQYYAPKLATQTVSVSNSPDAVADILRSIAEKLPV